jgi:acetyl-CoA carboxylase biotin carboxyl carrier protein
LAVFCCFLRFFGIFGIKSNIKFMDIKDIQNLIKFVSKAEVSEVKYKTKDFEITIKTPLAGSDAVYAQPAVYHTAPQAVAAPHLLLLRLPLLKKLKLHLMTANM